MAKKGKNKKPIVVTPVLPVLAKPVQEEGWLSWGMGKIFGTSSDAVVATPEIEMGDRADAPKDKEDLKLERLYLSELDDIFQINLAARKSVPEIKADLSILINGNKANANLMLNYIDQCATSLIEKNPENQGKVNALKRDFKKYTTELLGKLKDGIASPDSYETLTKVLRDRLASEALPPVAAPPVVSAPIVTEKEIPVASRKRSYEDRMRILKAVKTAAEKQRVQKQEIRVQEQAKPSGILSSLRNAYNIVTGGDISGMKSSAGANPLSVRDTSPVSPVIEPQTTPSLFSLITGFTEPTTVSLNSGEVYSEPALDKAKVFRAIKSAAKEQQELDKLFKIVKSPTKDEELERHRVAFEKGQARDKQKNARRAEKAKIALQHQEESIKSQRAEQKSLAAERIFRETQRAGQESLAAEQIFREAQAALTTPLIDTQSQDTHPLTTMSAAKDDTDLTAMLRAKERKDREANKAQAEARALVAEKLNQVAEKSSRADKRAIERHKEALTIPLTPAQSMGTIEQGHKEALANQAMLAVENEQRRLIQLEAIRLSEKKAQEQQNQRKQKINKIAAKLGITTNGSEPDLWSSAAAILMEKFEKLGFDLLKDFEVLFDSERGTLKSDLASIEMAVDNLLTEEAAEKLGKARVDLDKAESARQQVFMDLEKARTAGNSSSAIKELEVMNTDAQKILDQAHKDLFAAIKESGEVLRNSYSTRVFPVIRHLDGTDSARVKVNNYQKNFSRLIKFKGEPESVNIEVGGTPEYDIIDQYSSIKMIDKSDPNNIIILFKDFGDASLNQVVQDLNQALTKYFSNPKDVEVAKQELKLRLRETVEKCQELGGVELSVEQLEGKKTLEGILASDKVKAIAQDPLFNEEMTELTSVTKGMVELTSSSITAEKMPKMEEIEELTNATAEKMPIMLGFQNKVALLKENLDYYLTSDNLATDRANLELMFQDVIKDYRELKRANPGIILEGEKELKDFLGESNIGKLEGRGPAAHFIVKYIKSFLKLIGVETPLSNRKKMLDEVVGKTATISKGSENHPFNQAVKSLDSALTNYKAFTDFFSSPTKDMQIAGQTLQSCLRNVIKKDQELTESFELSAEQLEGMKVLERILASDKVKEIAKNPLFNKEIRELASAVGERMSGLNFKIMWLGTYLDNYLKNSSFTSIEDKKAELAKLESMFKTVIKDYRALKKANPMGPLAGEEELKNFLGKANIDIGRLEKRGKVAHFIVKYVKKLLKLVGVETPLSNKKKMLDKVIKRQGREVAKNL